MHVEASTVTVIVTAIIGAVPPTLMALAALIQGRKNGAKVEEVHQLTDGNLSKVSAALEVANKKIEGLEKLIGARKDRRHGDKKDG